MKSFKRYLSCFLAAAMLVGIFTFSAGAAVVTPLSAPRNCRFSSWSNSSFTSCKIKWNSVSGANKYNVQVTLTNGKAVKTIRTSSTSCTIKNLDDDHVYKVKVSALYVDPATGQTVRTSQFSNTAYIVPMPTELKMTITNSDHMKVKLEWNPIYGSNGYNVYLCTDDPTDGDWTWNTSSEKKATATSATIRKYQRKNLKKYETYYVRIVTRRRNSNGDFVSVPVPGSYYNAGFQMMFIR